MKKIDVLGINVTSGSVEELNDYVRVSLEEDQKKIILYVNIHGMNLAVKHNWMVDLYNSSDIVLCDGVGVLWGSRLLGSKISERVTLTNWGWVLANIFGEDGNSIFLLGNTDKVVKKASVVLRSHYTGLEISGIHNGYFDVEGEENIKVIEKINSSGTDVLFVGMGMPRQEQWIQENQDKLNVKMIISCGGLFKFWSGDHKRCPMWVSNAGLEWFYQFLHEPRRLFRRYFPSNFTFFLRIIKQKILGIGGSNIS